MLRRADKAAEAAALMATIPQLDDSHDLDEWWIERRLLVRKLLDEDDPKRAYIVARDATPPTRDNYRAEHQFTAGWVALRYLNDPTTADAHFKKVTEGAENPIRYGARRLLAGPGRGSPERSPRRPARTTRRRRAIPTAYYGQIARAKAGLGELPSTHRLPSPPPSAAALAKSEVVRAAELLYAVGRPRPAQCGDGGPRRQVERHRHPRHARRTRAEVPGPARHAAGRQAGARARLSARSCRLSDGRAAELHRDRPEVEPALVYSIARQESWFNPKTVSSANAMGLMQVTPAAGKYLAKKFNVTYDQKRLLSDNVYNLQMGAAELGDLIKDYRGSYIMTFAAYNAGPRPGARMDQPLRRSARSQGRSDRLGGAHPVLRDPQLRAARHGKRAGLSRPLRRRLPTADRGRPAARRDRTNRTTTDARRHRKALRACSSPRRTV